MTWFYRISSITSFLLTNSDNHSCILKAKLNS